MLGDDVGEVGVECPPPTLDWFSDEANMADDKAASMLASIGPEPDCDRSPVEGL